MPFATLFVLGQAAFATLSPSVARELSTAAAASPRPSECVRPASAVVGPNPWKRARHPGIERFCGALARGYAVLGSDPKSSLAAAAEASKAEPSRSEPWVLEGRALVLLGKFAPAYEKLAAAQKKSPLSVNAPEALYALAVSAYRTGKLADALDAYRALAPRVSLFEEPWLRQRVYVEAAAVCMTRGAAALDEAIGYLSEGRRQPRSPVFSDFVLGALALALERQGRVEEAAGVAAEADGPWRLARFIDADRELGALRPKLPYLPPGELDAMIAALAQGRDADMARRHWEAFLEQAKDSPFSEHARKKLAAPWRKTR